MVEQKKNGLRWVAGLGGLAVVVIGIWITAGDSPERREARRDGPAPPSRPAPSFAAPAPSLATPAPSSGAPAPAAPAPSSAAPAPPSATPVPSPAPPVLGPALRIAAHGRLTLDVDALPDEGPLTLVLDLSDEARGSGDRTVRIISADGRRIDTTASPLPGGGSGVRLEIDPGFLSSGRYLIEVDTEEKHPLQLSRYVLELR